MMSCIIGAQVAEAIFVDRLPCARAALAGPPSQPLQQGNLAEELLARLSRAPQQHGSSGDIGDNASLRTNLAALANAQMACHRRLASDLDEILENGRSGDTHLRHNHAAPSDADIVADVRQVVDPRTGAYRRR